MHVLTVVVFRQNGEQPYLVTTLFSLFSYKMCTQHTS